MLLQLYFGLLVFVGYIVVDTQEIVERAHLGDLDYVKHALTLFTDLVAVFVRILVIMVSLIVKQQPFYIFSSTLQICIDGIFPIIFQLKNSTERNEKKKKRRDWFSYQSAQLTLQLPWTVILKTAVYTVLFTC